jgi:hypothetical protein
MIILAGFTLAFMNLKDLLKPKEEWKWLRLLSGITGLITAFFYVLVMFDTIELTRVMVNPLIVLLVSILLSNTIYSKKTRGL